MDQCPFLRTGMPVVTPYRPVVLRCTSFTTKPDKANNGTHNFVWVFLSICSRLRHRQLLQTGFYELGMTQLPS